MVPAYALSVWVVVNVLLLLYFDQRGDAARARLAKTSASLGFVALALVLDALNAPNAPNAGAHGMYGYAVTAGLVLSTGGDVALAFPGSKPFTAGLVLFLLGHVCYVVAAAARLPMSQWPSLWSLLPLACSLGAAAWLWPHLGSMRIPVVAYVLTITVMVIGALAVARHDEGEVALPLGAVLFYLSDLSVARDRFVSHGFVNRAWGLPAYYAGQLFFAWSLAP